MPWECAVSDVAWQEHVSQSQTHCLLVKSPCDYYITQIKSFTPVMFSSPKPSPFSGLLVTQRKDFKFWCTFREVASTVTLKCLSCCTVGVFFTFRQGGKNRVQWLFSSTEEAGSQTSSLQRHQPSAAGHSCAAQTGKRGVTRTHNISRTGSVSISQKVSSDQSAEPEETRLFSQRSFWGFAASPHFRHRVFVLLLEAIEKVKKTKKQLAHLRHTDNSRQKSSF